MIGFVSETRGVDGYVGTLVGQVDERRVVGVLPIDVNLKIEILFIKNSRSIKILSFVSMALVYKNTLLST